MSAYQRSTRSLTFREVADRRLSTTAAPTNEARDHEGDDDDDCHLTGSASRSTNSIAFPTQGHQAWCLVTFFYLPPLSHSADTQTRFRFCSHTGANPILKVDSRGNCGAANGKGDYQARSYWSVSATGAGMWQKVYTPGSPDF